MRVQSLHRDSWILAGQLVEQYEALVLADRPLCYLPLTEAVGTVAWDHSGLGNAATYRGNVQLAAHAGPCPSLGWVTLFDGATAYVQLPNAIALLSGGTVEAWACPTAWGNTGDNYLNENEFVVAADPGIRLSVGINGAGQPSASASVLMATPTGSNWYYAPGGLTALNMWTHLAVVVVPGQTLTLVVNGAAVATTPLPSGTVGFNASTPYTIGVDNYGGNYHEFFHGAIAAVAFYPYPLTLDQLAAHAVAGRTAILSLDGGGNVYGG